MGKFTLVLHYVSKIQGLDVFAQAVTTVLTSYCSPATCERVLFRPADTKELLKLCAQKQLAWDRKHVHNLFVDVMRILQHTEKRTRVAKVKIRSMGLWTQAGGGVKRASACRYELELRIKPRVL